MQDRSGYKHYLSVGMMGVHMLVEARTLPAARSSAQYYDRHGAVSDILLLLQARVDKWN